MCVCVSIPNSVHLSPKTTEMPNTSTIRQVSLLDWSSSGTDRLPLVDLRTDRDDGTLTGGGGIVPVVHLPWPSLRSGERSGELPPRHVGFGLLLNAELWRDHEREISSFFGATVSRATGQSRRPWRVGCAVLIEDKERFWNEAKELGLSQQEAAGPLPRLWQPDPLLPGVLWPRLKAILADKLANASLPPGEPACSLRIWDLGSGAGRDVCYLAEQIKHTFATSGGRVTVVGLDNHKASAKRCLPLWKHRGVDDYTEARLVDVTKLGSIAEQPTPICVYAVRFWHRKAIESLQRQLPAGTLFGTSHFCKPFRGAKWGFDHPKVGTLHCTALHCTAV